MINLFPIIEHTDNTSTIILKGLEWFFFSPVKYINAILYESSRGSLFPVTVAPKYQCSHLGGWWCTDVSNSILWIILVVFIVLLFFNFVIRKPKEINYLSCLSRLVLSWHGGLILSFILYFLTRLIFPEPKSN